MPEDPADHGRLFRLRRLLIIANRVRGLAADSVRLSLMRRVVSSSRY
jgi:hypothetical protein